MIPLGNQIPAFFHNLICVLYPLSSDLDGQVVEPLAPFDLSPKNVRGPGRGDTFGEPKNQVPPDAILTRSCRAPSK
jgi:hypothetical protein